MQNTQLDIDKIADSIFENLSKQYLLFEMVFIPSKECNGKIITEDKFYTDTVGSKTIEVTYKDPSSDIPHLKEVYNTAFKANKPGYAAFSWRCHLPFHKHRRMRCICGPA